MRVITFLLLPSMVASFIVPFVAKSSRQTPLFSQTANDICPLLPTPQSSTTAEFAMG